MPSFLALLFSVFIFSSCAAQNSYDVLLDATPVNVKPIDRTSVTDAVAGNTQAIETPHAVVVFHVNWVRRGEFASRRGGPSRFEQISDSVKDKDFLGAFNYKDPDEMISKEWVSVAVEDPKASFGLDYGEVSSEKRYRLYLKQVPGKPETYYMIKSNPGRQK